jgi:flagellar hook-associated protein 2
LQISAAAGTETTVSFSRDIEAAKLSMEAMIEELNATRKLLDDLSARGVGGAEAGALAGDRLVEKLKSDLTKMLSQPIEGFGSSAKRLLDFGVATNRDGTLRLDVTRFERAFASDPASFDMLFNDRLSSNVEGLTVGGALGPAARPGVYNFVRDAGTGVATLDDTQMLGLSVSPGSRRFVLFQGNLSGIQLDVPDGVDEAEVRYGRSFLSSLESLLDTALSSGANSLSERETQLTERLTDTTTQIEELEARQVTLEQRYLSRFTAMETAIAGLRSTGAYLTNLVAQWNKST